MTALLRARSGSGSKRVFARHFGEMLLAMFAGMLVLGGPAELIFAMAGSSLSSQSAALQVTLMGFNMTVPMVMWMSYRGHSRFRSAEMAGSMVVPTLIAAVLALAGVLGETAALTLQHSVMIPAMLGVMLWRYEHYSHHPR
jgi:flagellar biosynthetic protein FliP